MSILRHSYKYIVALFFCGSVSLSAQTVVPQVVDNDEAPITIPKLPSAGQVQQGQVQQGQTPVLPSIGGGPQAGQLPQAGLPPGMTQQDLMKMLQQQMGQQQSIKSQLGSETIDEIAELDQPIPVLSPWRWLYYALALLIVIVLIVVIIKLMFKPTPVIVRKPYEIAFEELRRIRAEMDKENARDFSTQVSDVIRRYIEGRFAVESTRATTDEFMDLVRNNKKGVLKDHMQLLCEFLEHCDLAKFAGCQFSKAQMEEMMDSAWRFVDETKIEWNSDDLNNENSETVSDTALEDQVIEPEVVDKGGIS